jgi:hypothetical protein
MGGAALDSRRRRVLDGIDPRRSPWMLGIPRAGWRKPPMSRAFPALLARVLATALLLAPAAGATTLTLSQAQLLAADEVTTLFGGNGQVLSRVADGDGVLFEIQGGTIDFGKVALRVLLNGADLTAYSEFGLRIAIVSAPNPVEVNPYIQTGSTGTIFHQDVPGVKVQGDVFDSFVPLAGVAQLNNAFGIGFQYFTAGNVEEPAAQTVLIRVSPIPEPGTLLPAALGIAALGAGARRAAARRLSAPA